MKNRNQLYQYVELETDYIKSIDRLVNFLSKELKLPKEEKKSNRNFIKLLKKGNI